MIAEGTGMGVERPEGGFADQCERFFRKLNIFMIVSQLFTEV